MCRELGTLKLAIDSTIREPGDVCGSSLAREELREGSHLGKGLRKRRKGQGSAGRKTGNPGLNAQLSFLFPTT